MHYLFKKNCDFQLLGPNIGIGTGRDWQILVPNLGAGLGPRYFKSHQRDRDRDQIMSSPVDETGTGPCSVPGLGPGRESRRGLPGIK